MARREQTESVKAAAHAKNSTDETSGRGTARLTSGKKKAKPSGVDALKPCMNSFVTCFHSELLGTTPIPDPGQPVLRWEFA